MSMSFLPVSAPSRVTMSAANVHDSRMMLGAVDAIEPGKRAAASRIQTDKIEVEEVIVGKGWFLGV